MPVCMCVSIKEVEKRSFFILSVLQQSEHPLCIKRSFDGNERDLLKYRLLLIYPSLADCIWTMLWTCWSQDFSGSRDEPGGNLEDDLHLTRMRWRCGRGMLCHCESNDRRAQWTEAGWLTERRKWLWRSDDEKIKFDRTLNSRLLDVWVISKTSDLVGCSRSSVASIHQKWSKGGTVVNRQLGNGWQHSRMHMGNKGSPMWSNPTVELM